MHNFTFLFLFIITFSCQIPWSLLHKIVDIDTYLRLLYKHFRF